MSVVFGTTTDDSSLNQMELNVGQSGFGNSVSDSNMQNLEPSLFGS